MAEALQVIGTTRNSPTLLALANGQKGESTFQEHRRCPIDPSTGSQTTAQDGKLPPPATRTGPSA